MKRLTKEWLKKENACCSGYRYFLKLKTNDLKVVFDSLIKDNELQDTNWLISRKLNKKDKIRYAIYAAKKVLDNFELKHPDDDRPRKAIEAAEKCIKSNTEKNRLAAYSAADSAHSAAYSAARSAAYSAALIDILNYGIELLYNKAVK